MADLPSHQHENILVATIGISPAVLTETVWALAHRSPPVVVDRVIVITTKRGKDDLLQKLLGEQSAQWVRLQQVLQKNGYHVQDKLRLHPSDIRIIEANGQELEDIRSTDDNRAVGNQILHILLELTANPTCTVYASLAGGRRTMSSLLLSAMSVCARPQDRVLHVLVNEPFDNPRLSPPFYFPDPTIEYHEYSKENTTQRTPPKKARIELAEIPIPSFREFLDYVPESDRATLTLEGVAHVVRRGSEEAVTQRLINQPINVEDCLRKTPLLKWLGESLPQRYKSNDPLPFSSLHVLLVLHCLTNLVSFTWAMQQLGLKKATFFIKEYPYPQKHPIRRWLEDKKYEVFDLNEERLPSYLSGLEHGPDSLLIVEDGGWITKTILERFPNLRSRVVGVMEQTTKGLWRIEDAIKKLPNDQQAKLFPILLLPYSSHKLDFEPPHIGRGIVRAIDQMIPDYLDGMHVGLFGFGTIGKQVANSLVDMGARVTVFDPEYTKQVRQSGHGHVTFANDSENAVKNKRLGRVDEFIGP
ncbi:MAG: CRISPR-associated ring nuclease Csm6 [Gemmatales bacterium]|nr:CRISPR-associated ring nuclease Csm6 [Gemmatales bacterium]